MFVPPPFAKDAVIEAIDAEIPLAVVITEGIPVHDSAAFWAHAVGQGRQDPDHRPQLPRHRLAPASRNAGIIPADITGPGRIGLVSKSGTLTYQMMYELRDFGFSTCRRHRRRPGHRDHAHRRARGVRGGPGDRRDRDDR